MSRSRGGNVGVWMRPAGAVHLVNRIEKDEILHVGVLLERGRRKRLRAVARPAQGRDRCDGTVLAHCDELLLLQLLQKTGDVALDVLARTAESCGDRRRDGAPIRAG